MLRSHATAVLHTWGSVMAHHPHLHVIGPDGGISLKPAPAQARRAPETVRTRRPPPVRVLSRLFRRLFLAGCADAHGAGRLAVAGEELNLAASMR